MNSAGEVAYWVKRATFAELKRVKDEEMARPMLTRSMMLVRAIDEELFKRQSVWADAFKL